MWVIILFLNVMRVSIVYKQMALFAVLKKVIRYKH